MNEQQCTMEECQKLYDEVWNEPITIVSQRYGISGNALKKRCMKIDVPVPSAGYWAKLKAGKPVDKLALPKNPSWMAKRNLQGYALSFRMPLIEFSDDELHNEEPLFPFSEQTKFLLSKMAENHPIQKQLRNPQNLITQHKDILIARSKHERMRKKYEGYENIITPPDEYYNFKDQNILKIDIEASRIHRSYCILQAFFECIKDLEGSIHITNVYRKDGGTIHISSSNWEFRMSETQILNHNDTYIMKLELNSSDDYFWGNDHRNYHEQLYFKDLPGKPLEMQFGNIIYELMVKVGKHAQKYEIEHRKWVREQEEYKRKEYLKRLSEAEKS